MRTRVLAVLTAEENRKWLTLFAVSFGLFMIMLDNTVVNVALPTMQRDLHVSISQLEWVVIAYALTFAALLITGGKLGDLYGRRRIFVIGLSSQTVTRLTDYPADPTANDSFPTWVGSTQVGFSSDTGGNDQVYELASTAMMSSGGLVLPSAIEPWFGPN